MNGSPEQGTTVVASAGMQAPKAEELYMRHAYTSRPDAPATHARMTYIAPDQYALNYNGEDLIRFNFEPQHHYGIRPHSDGDFQSELLSSSS